MYREEVLTPRIGASKLQSKMSSYSNRKFRCFWAFFVVISVASTLVVCWPSVALSPGEEAYFVEPEEWAAAAMEHGEGRIRYIGSSGKDGDAYDVQAVSTEAALEVKSAGRLSSDGLRWSLGTCAGFIAESDKKLGNDEQGLGGDRAAIAYRQCEALQVMCLYKAVEELIQRGAYITYLAGEAPPVCPKGCTYIEMAGMPLETGGTANLVVWVDLKHRRGLADTYQLLAETRQAARWERLRAWNNRPESERRTEIDDYLALSQKANGQAAKNLSADEFARYWGLHALLLELDAEAIHGSTMIFERQGAAGR